MKKNNQMADVDTSRLGRHYEKSPAEMYPGTRGPKSDDPTVTGRHYDNNDPVGPAVKNQPWAPEGNGIDKSGDRLASMYKDSPSKRELDGFNVIEYNGGAANNTVSEIAVNPYRNDRGKES